MRNIAKLTFFAVVAIGAIAVASPRAVSQPMNVVAVLTHEDALNEAHDIQLQGNLAFVPGHGVQRSGS